MLSNISIQTKLLFALALIIFINVIGGGFVAYSIAKANQAAIAVENISALQSHASDIEDTALSTRNYVSSFLNSGDLTKKNQYEKKH